MFWCYMSLVVIYIACCCLDGEDLKPKWHKTVAIKLRNEADKLFELPPRIVLMKPNAVDVRVAIEIPPHEYSCFSRRFDEERLKKENEMRIVYGISKKLLANKLVEIKDEVDCFGMKRIVGRIIVCKL